MHRLICHTNEFIKSLKSNVNFDFSKKNKQNDTQIFRPENVEAVIIDIVFKPFALSII